MYPIVQLNNRSLRRWIVLLFAAGVAPAVVSAQTLFTVYELPTYDAKTYYVIDTDETSGAALRGLAVDDGGQIYVSDQGDPNERTGVVYMLRGTNEAVRVHERLEAPGDIELTPDQRGLVIARKGGGVDLRYFGVTVHILNDDVVDILNVRPVLITDFGAIPGVRRADGYIHFPNVLRPGQESLEATLVFDQLDPPQAHTLSLANPHTGAITGQVFVELELIE